MVPSETRAPAAPPTGPPPGHFADAVVGTIALLAAVATGIGASTSSARPAELVVAGATTLGGYLAGWRAGRAAAVAGAVAYLVLEHLFGRLGYAHYWEETLVATGIVCAGLAAAYLRLSVERARTRLTAAQAQLAELNASDDITDRLAAGRRLQPLAYELERSRRYNHQLCLIVMRPDELEDLVERLGGAAVEAVLGRVAEAMGRSLRATDIAQHEAASTFWAILPETVPEAARVVAERIRLAVATRSLEGAPGEIVDLTVSIGVASFPEDATTDEELVAAAGRALDHAVSLGGNRTILHSLRQGPAGWSLQSVPAVPSLDRA